MTGSRHEALAETVSDVLYAAAGWLSVGLGLAAAVAVVLHAVRGVEALPLVVISVVSLLFLVFGVMVNPYLRDRLARRRGLARFGRAATVDRRVVRPAENHGERCVRCDRPVETGVVRRYREEFLFAGVPVATASEGRNSYCADCATDEMVASEAVNAAETETNVPEERPAGDDRRAAETDRGRSR